MVPEVVSFTADAEGRVIKPAMLESKRSATNDRLFLDVCFDITGTTDSAHSHERYNTAPLLPNYLYHFLPIISLNRAQKYQFLFKISNSS